MHEAVFNISIDDAGQFLKKIGLFKSKKYLNRGKYSEETLFARKSKDFAQIYQTAIDNNDYELLLDDDSIFQFSKEGQKLRYAFIQSQFTYLSFYDFLLERFDYTEIPQDEELIEEYKVSFAEEYEQRKNEQKINIGAMYIRYDVDTEGYCPNIHSYAHIHVGLTDDFRLPCSIILTPISFVYFVVKHVYISNWKSIINNNAIKNDVLKFKEYCEIIPEKYWKISEQNELYLI